MWRSLNKRERETLFYRLHRTTQTAAFLGPYRHHVHRNTCRGVERIWILFVTVAIPEFISMGARARLGHMFHISHSWGGIKVSH